MDANSIPGYTIKKKLGAGAMAAVFLAKEKKLDRDVALKIMSSKLLKDPSFAERFLREARIVASISQRNIVTVFDVGSHNNYHYMAMEFLPGGDLTGKLKQGIPLQEAIAHVIDIAEGLNHAASKNFIHRDIKPDNIMFSEDKRAVITDFGIARNTASETNMTMVGSIIGTPQYMSPEQASAEKLDHRTDLYSLGIILYEILTGAPPFKGNSAISTGVMHITQPVPLLPPEFEQFQDFIDTALAKNPDERFQSGHEFIEALQKIDLDAFENYESSSQIISPEDLVDTFEDDDFYSGFNSSLNSGGLDTDARSGANVYYAMNGINDSNLYPEEKTSFLLPFTLISLLVILLGSVAGYFYYTKTLGKQLALPDKLFGEIVQGKDELSGLNPEERKLVEAMNNAMKDDRLFTPPFDCADLYFAELIKINPESEIVKNKAEEFLELSLETTSKLLYNNEIEKAYQVITNAKRLLPHVRDKALRLKHRQLTSSVLIER